jgi:hypothetical protein
MKRRLIAHANNDDKSITMFIQSDDRDYIFLIEWCENSKFGPYLLWPKSGLISFDNERDYVMFLLKWS